MRAQSVVVVVVVIGLSKEETGLNGIACYIRVGRDTIPGISILAQ